MQAQERPPSVRRFFLHYPVGHRAYIVIVDGQRRPFDFSDNTFKFAKTLASPRDACLYASGNHDDRANHGYCYSVEFDTQRLRAGNPETAPTEGAAVTVHWLIQVGDYPDVTVDVRMPRTCTLNCDDGRFEPKNQWDRDALDETLAFEKRAKLGEEHRAFILSEIDQREPLFQRLGAAVDAGDTATILRVLAEDLAGWASSLKPHLVHHVMYCATDPMLVRMIDVPKDAPFEFLETWAMRDWLGRIEAYDLLEFHKGSEYAKSFAARFDQLSEARVRFARLLAQYTVQTRGEDAEGMVALDDIRKTLKRHALAIADHVARIAGLFGPKTSDPRRPADLQAGVEVAEVSMKGNATSSTTNETEILAQFAKALGTFTSLLNEIIIEANHPEIESFEDAINWTTKRQAQLKRAHDNVERLAGTKLVAEIVPPAGMTAEQCIVQLLAKVAECQYAISYVFTSGPPKARSSDPRAEMAANVVSKQMEIASNLVREIESCRRIIVATSKARRATAASDEFEEPTPKGDEVRSPDRVEADLNEIHAAVAAIGWLSDKVDAKAILALADPILSDARRFVEWASDGPLDEAGAEMLLQIGEKWLELERVLDASSIGPTDNTWFLGNDENDLQRAAECWRSLAQDVRKNSDVLRYLPDISNVCLVSIAPNANMGMPHARFAKRLAVAIESLRMAFPNPIATQQSPAPASNGQGEPLVIDISTFGISWLGNGPHVLGNRKEFHLLAELWTSRDKFVPHVELAERLGGDDNDDITYIKSRLVKWLKSCGLADLAARIKTQKGHYGLFIS